MNTPKTYTEAIKVAETISADEFAQLVAATPHATIFVPRTTRRHAMEIRPTTWGRNAYSYSYCTRSGYSHVDIIRVDRLDDRPVFEFYNVGRIVVVERQSAADAEAARLKTMISLEASMPKKGNDEFMASMTNADLIAMFAARAKKVRYWSTSELSAFDRHKRAEQITFHTRKLEEVRDEMELRFPSTFIDSLDDTRSNGGK